MVYTVTFNPAIDYIMEIEKLNVGKINKSKKEKILPGGKGINVSIVLTNLGEDNVALGFKAGFTGNKIEEEVKKLGVKTDFIDVKKGMSRINVKIIETANVAKNLENRENELSMSNLENRENELNMSNLENRETTLNENNLENEETAINGNGPKITEENINELYRKIDKINNGDFLVLSGSIPNTLPNDIYENICKRLVDKKINVVADATDNLLVNVLKYKPFLIKPNEEELAEIFKIKINSEEEIIECSKKLQEMGAQNVLVSRGENGGILVTSDNETIKMSAPSGKRVNTVGAGDSMVAGFITGYIYKEDYKEAFKLGLASGTASACSENLATKEEIMNYYSKI